LFRFTFTFLHTASPISWHWTCPLTSLFLEFGCLNVCAVLEDLQYHDLMTSNIKYPSYTSTCIDIQEGSPMNHSPGCPPCSHRILPLVYVTFQHLYAHFKQA
jgi:hypothetical protein